MTMGFIDWTITNMKYSFILNLHIQMLYLSNKIELFCCINFAKEIGYRYVIKTNLMLTNSEIPYIQSNHEIYIGLVLSKSKSILLTKVHNNYFHLYIDMCDIPNSTYKLYLRIMKRLFFLYYQTNNFEQYGLRCVGNNFQFCASTEINHIYKSKWVSRNLTTLLFIKYFICKFKHYVSYIEKYQLYIHRKIE